jgi:SPP1 gp7 family putative phage head morphogenesis protein
VAVIELGDVLGNWHDSQSLIPQASDKQHWPGWERDQQLASVYAPQIAAAFSDGMASARSFLTQLIAGEVRVTPTYAAQEVRNRLAMALKPVLTLLWTEGYTLGAISARHVLANLPAAPASTTSASDLITKLNTSTNPYPEYTTGPDWGEWEPGDIESALRVDTAPRLQQLLQQWGINTIQSVSETKLDDLARYISIALATGQDSSSLANDISGLLNVPSRAQMIAQTELTRASTAAALDQYLSAGVSTKEWLTAPDERVCVACTANSIEGSIPLQQSFLSGIDGPPQHPRCRCSVIPAAVGDFDLSDMTVEPLPGFNLVPLGQPVMASERRPKVEKKHPGEKAITCGHGHKHWGQYGAAGMMIRGRRPNGDVVYLLQKRADTAFDSKGKWALFGGGLLAGETPLEGATREVNEELGKVHVVDSGASLKMINKVGKEGYIHGFICIRPPCGKKPDKIKVSDLWISSHGEVIHEKSRWSIAHVERGSSGKGWDVYHADGELTHHSTTLGVKMETVKRYKSCLAAEQQRTDVHPVTVKPAVTYRPGPSLGRTGDAVWQTQEGTVDLSDADKSAIARVWYGPSFHATQRLLRDNNTYGISQEKLPQMMADIGTLKNAINRSEPFESAVELRRGMSYPDDVFGRPGSMIDKLFTDDGFVSTTSNTGKDVTGAFANLEGDADPGETALIRIKASAGTRALKIGNDVFKLAMGEQAANAFPVGKLQEYTLSAGTQFRVISDALDDNGVRQISMEVVL